MSGNDLTLPEDFRGIFVGGSTPLEMLHSALNRSVKGRFWYVFSGSEALDIVSHNDIHAVIIEPRSFGGPDPTALLAFQLRSMHPEIAIVLFTSDEEFEVMFGDSSPSVRHRLSHYFRLRRSNKSRYSYWDTLEPEHLSQILRGGPAEISEGPRALRCRHFFAGP